MIVLDTNVLSELMRAGGSQQVFDWLADRSRDELHTTVVTQAEILAGIAILPQGRRREMLEVLADRMFAEDFQDRMLTFDGDAARRYAEIVALRRAVGRPIEPLDAMIAAIARVHDASVATRNIRDFEGCGVKLVDPWQAA